MSATPPILYCHCAHAQVTPASVREAALRRLAESGAAVETVADLCGLAADGAALRERLGPFADPENPPVILACHPRTVRALFAAAQAAPLPENTRWINLRAESGEAVCAALEAILPSVPQKETGSAKTLEKTRATLEAEAAAASWKPWFPVLDGERCTQCRQCLNFCLFGVYALEEEQIRVRNPRACKPDCPACARVCPEAAILFPKHPAAIINGGQTPEKEADVEGAIATHLPASLKVDLSSLLGGDIYALLRQRSGAAAAERFSTERDPALALAERRKYLDALEKQPPPPHAS